jgi:NADH-quinone oxidoreductase subunit D
LTPLATMPTDPHSLAIQSLSFDEEEQLLRVSLGPQHPSTHGVFRMNVELDGETVVKLKPVFGYLHRNHEKIAESIGYLGSMPYTDRLDYICPLSNNWAYALSVEKLAGIDVPERAQYMRVILAELTRLVNHTAFMGFILADMGAWGSALMYAFREREKILDLFEDLTGARMMANFMRFGGCRNDFPDGWESRFRALVDTYPQFLDEMEAFLLGNEILLARTRDIGALPKETLVNGGITGPMLRAAGLNYDLRKADPYGIYDRFAFRIPLGGIGDCYDRIMIRFLEMRESLEILKQAAAALPAGDFVNPKVKIRNFKPPVGESYARVEGPKGELGFHLVSDGGPNPYRYRVRPPSFINLTLLEDMCLGLDLADVVVILGSIDIVLGEVDR